MIRELRTAEGGLASALDADSEGEEGKFYVWTPGELTEVLGSDDGVFAAETFRVTKAGTFEHGRSVLQLRADPADTGRFARVRAVLLAARDQRIRPGRDDKVVAAWNGLAIAALAETGLLLGRPDLVAAATGAPSCWPGAHLRDRDRRPGPAGAPRAWRLLRTSRDGVAGQSAGLLEDYACVADGLIALSGVTGEPRWVELAGSLLDTALGRFTDGQGGFFDTADDGEALLYRPADPTDTPTPSGTFAVAGALLSYAALTGSSPHRQAALAALGPLGAIAGRFPRRRGPGSRWPRRCWPAEIAIVGPPGDPRTAELHTAALRAATPGAVIAIGAGSGESAIGLLAGRGLVNNRPAAYVCRNFTCRMPVIDAAALESALSGRE